MWPKGRAFPKISHRRARTSWSHVPCISRSRLTPRPAMSCWRASSARWRMLSGKFDPAQAAGIRAAVRPDPVQVIAVTGGKGGVGKTSVSVNLATAMAAAGKRVVLLDGDLGLANADVFLGLSPRYTLAHVLSGERTLDEVVITAPQGFLVVPAASGAADMANMGETEHLGLVQAFSTLAARVDVLIVDTAAGIAHSVLQFSQACQHV